MEIRPSNSGKTVVIIDKAFDADGFETTNNMAFIAFDSTKFKTVDEAVAKAKTFNWKLVEQLDGSFKAVRV